MDINTESSLLRIYLSSTDSINHKPLYEHLIFQAKKEGMAGATVLRGVMGFGASSKIHTSKFWGLTEKLPVVIEVVDQTEKVKLFYQKIKPVLNEVPKGILVTIEKRSVVMYKSGKQES